MRKPPVVHLLDEVPKHFLRNLKVCDDSILKRTNRGNGSGGTAKHSLGFCTNGVNLAIALVNRNHTWLRKHNAPTPDIHKGVGRAEINGHIAAVQAKEV
jgi:hypothetical protein